MHHCRPFFYATSPENKALRRSALVSNPRSEISPQSYFLGRLCCRKKVAFHFSGRLQSSLTPTCCYGPDRFGLSPIDHATGSTLEQRGLRFTLNETAGQKCVGYFLFRSSCSPAFVCGRFYTDERFAARPTLIDVLEPFPIELFCPR